MAQQKPRGNSPLDRQPGRGAGRRIRRAAVARWALLAGLSAAFLASVSRVAADLIIRRWQPLQDGACAAVAVASLCLIGMLVSRARFHGRTIRGRLLVVLVSLSLLSAIGTTAGSIVVGTITGQRQAFARLESLAGERELRIRAWCDSVTNEVRTVLGDEYSLDRARLSLKLATWDALYPYFKGAMLSRLEWFASQSQQKVEYSLLDNSGTVVLSTGDDGPLPDDARAALTAAAGSTPWIRLPSCSDGPARAVLVALPVDDDNGSRLGSFTIAAAPDGLFSVLSDSTGMGESGKAFLLDSAGNPIARQDGAQVSGPSCGDLKPRTVYAGRIGAAVSGTADSSNVYLDYRGVRVIGAFRSLPDLGAMLVVEQDLGEALSGVYTTVGVNVAIALVLVLIAVTASLILTRSITTPLVHLSQTAARITAGELSVEAAVERDDEVGDLAGAFNSMTAQLRDLFKGLEQRVEERTHALEKRALQLETSADVSREITSILTIDELLRRVVQRIREAFGYNHVQVYLVEGDGRMLVRRAGDDDGAPGRRLEIGPGSLNGQVAASSQSQRANDVTQNPHYQDDRRTPTTRSEAVVPLCIAGRVIGTLDVQSSEANAFSDEDVAVLQSLGDQIAVAIENARLYDRSQELAVLKERNRMARELHDSVTQSLYSLALFAQAGEEHIERNSFDQIKPLLIRIGETADTAIKQMRLQLYQLRPPELEQEGLMGAIRRRLEAVEERTGVKVELVADATISLPVDVEEGLYAIAQEALNNALRHSAAGAVTVAVRPEGEWVTLEVTDNGRGFDPQALANLGGMGLSSIGERARELGGSLSIESAPGKGTRVRARVPREGKHG